MPAEIHRGSFCQNVSNFDVLYPYLLTDKTHPDL